MNTDKGKVSRSICRDVQALIYDYMSRDLGPARSDFVREHVLRCDECRAELAAIQKTFDLLSLARKAPVPDRLSAHRRRRMSRAVMHPVVDWICNHSFVVAFASTLFAVLIAVLILRWAMQIDYRDDSDAVPIDLTPRDIPGLDLSAPNRQPVPSQEAPK